MRCIKEDADIADAADGGEDFLKISREPENKVAVSKKNAYNIAIAF